MEEFCVRLKEVRTARKITQKELAKKLGIAEGSVQHYEHGTIKPTSDIIINIACILEISSDYLLGITDTFDTQNTKSSTADIAADCLDKIKTVINKLPSLEKCPSFIVCRNIYTLTHLGYVVKDMNKSQVSKYITQLEDKLSKDFAFSELPYSEDAQHLLLQAQAALNRLSKDLMLPKIYLSAELADEERNLGTYMDVQKILMNAEALVKTAKDFGI